MSEIKFKPGDAVVISQESKNVWIRGMRGEIVRFLEEENYAGSFYQWTYLIKLEDGHNAYVQQWDIQLCNNSLLQ